MQKLLLQIILLSKYTFKFFTGKDLANMIFYSDMIDSNKLFLHLKTLSKRTKLNGSRFKRENLLTG